MQSPEYVSIERPFDSNTRWVACIAGSALRGNVLDADTVLAAHAQEGLIICACEHTCVPRGRAQR